MVMIKILSKENIASKRYSIIVKEYFQINLWFFQDWSLTFEWFLNCFDTKRKHIVNYFVGYHKQPSRSVLRKRCSGNIKQIYGRTPNAECEVTFLKLYFGMGEMGGKWEMGVLLQNFFIFLEHLFVKTPLEGCFWTML